MMMIVNSITLLFDPSPDDDTFTSQAVHFLTDFQQITPTIFCSLPAAAAADVAGQSDLTFSV
jgi:hypothetical protein